MIREKIHIPLGDNMHIVAEKAENYDGDGHSEMYLYIEDSRGVHQDIALFRPHMVDLIKGTEDPSAVDLLVWASPDIEDFTDDYTIPVADYD